MRPQLKICGLTSPEEARLCCEAGADAIGLVFYKTSPRNVTPQQARQIVRAIPSGKVPVGVFVSQKAAEIVEVAEYAALQTVQLHGRSLPDTAVLRRAGLRIVRVLFDLIPPDPLPDADAFLIECGRGLLPGGNAEVWDWQAAHALVSELPLPCGLAGGLEAATVAGALLGSGAVAADVSSGVEISPGRKNPAAVRRFAEAVKSLKIAKCETVF